MTSVSVDGREYISKRDHDLALKDQALYYSEREARHAASLKRVVDASPSIRLLQRMELGPDTIQLDISVDTYAAECGTHGIRRFCEDVGYKAGMQLLHYIEAEKARKDTIRKAQWANRDKDR